MGQLVEFLQFLGVRYEFRPSRISPADALGSWEISHVSLKLL